MSAINSEQAEASYWPSGSFSSERAPWPKQVNTGINSEKNRRFAFARHVVGTCNQVGSPKGRSLSAAADIFTYLTEEVDVDAPEPQ